MAIRYPYSKANYDAAAKLLDQAHFKLRHSANSSLAIQVTLGITPLELQKRLAIKLVQEEDSSDSKEEEGADALDLHITDGEGWRLEPDLRYGRSGDQGGEHGRPEERDGVGEEERRGEVGRESGGEEGREGWGEYEAMHVESQEDMVVGGVTDVPDFACS